jgi:predicted Fe-S protein YdhL (DUF1289 family)
MVLQNQVVWSSLTEAQRTRILSLLVQMLLRQLPERKEAKPS